MNQQNYSLHGLTADFDLRFAFLAAICFGFILLVVMTSNLLMTNASGQEATEEEVDNIKESTPTRAA